MNNYPALEIIAYFWKILSYIAPVITFISGLMIASELGGGAFFGMIILYGLLAGLVWLIFSAYSELTILFVNIADDLRSMREK
tara:strand:- start:82 stop:330 length:249 start_codon:yes stop_codon:yes gene_type:complete